MEFVKIRTTNEEQIEVNLNQLSVVRQNEYSSYIELVFGGYSVTVNREEFDRIKQLLETTGDDKNKLTTFKEIIYRAAYLDSNAKLQLIMQLENIE